MPPRCFFAGNATGGTAPLVVEGTGCCDRDPVPHRPSAAGEEHPVATTGAGIATAGAIGKLGANE